MSTIAICDQEELKKIKQDAENFIIQADSCIILNTTISVEDANSIIEVLQNKSIAPQLNKIKTIEIHLYKENERNNQLEDLIKYIVSNAHLLEIILKGNNQELNQKQIQFYLDIIQQLKGQLNKLDIDLQKTSSNVDVLAKIGESLSGLGELTHFSFNFSYNPIGKAKELGKFGKQLESQSKMTKLQELNLDMSNMHMGHANVHSYTQFVMQNGQTLQKLSLNFDNNCIEKKGAESIKKMIQHITQVKEVKLILSNNGLMDLFLKDMLRAYTLSNEQKVQHLTINLAGNYLSHEVCEFVHSTFLHNSLAELSYLHLNLSKNKINGKALEHLVKIIENSQTIKQFILDISYSREKLDGILCVAESIQRSKSVQSVSLNIKGNGIAASTVQELVKHIENTDSPHLSRFGLEIDDAILQNADSEILITKPSVVFLNSALI